MMESHFNCFSCKDIPNQAYESECCGNLYCYNCSESLNYLNCTKCKSALKFRISKFAMSMMNSIDIKCKHDCGSEYKVSQNKTHLLRCKNKEFKCNIEFCGNRQNIDESKAHLLENHQKQILLLAENYNDFKNVMERYYKSMDNDNNNKTNNNNNKSSNKSSNNNLIGTINPKDFKVNLLDRIKSPTSNMLRRFPLKNNYNDSGIDNYSDINSNNSISLINFNDKNKKNVNLLSTDQLNNKHKKEMSSKTKFKFNLNNKREFNYNDYPIYDSFDVMENHVDSLEIFQKQRNNHIENNLNFRDNLNNNSLLLDDSIDNNIHKFTSIGYIKCNKDTTNKPLKIQLKNNKNNNNNNNSNNSNKIEQPILHIEQEPTNLSNNNDKLLLDTVIKNDKTDLDFTSHTGKVNDNSFNNHNDTINNIKKNLNDIDKFRESNNKFNNDIINNDNNNSIHNIINKNTNRLDNLGIEEEEKNDIEDNNNEFYNL